MGPGYKGLKSGKVLAILALAVALTGPGAAWWNSEWTYRKPFSVSNPTGNDVTNFPANVTLNTKQLIDNGKIQSDCGDLRIVEGDPGKVLKYNVTDCNTTDTTVFFSVDVAPGSTNQDLYIYYGNPSASEAEQDVPTRIINGNGESGSMAYWCSNRESSAPQGLDSFYSGTACDGKNQSDSAQWESDYTGYDRIVNSATGDWMTGPVTGGPTVSEGEDDSVLDASDTNTPGYNAFLAYSGNASGIGLKGVKVPGGVQAHAWFHVQWQSMDADHCSDNIWVGTRNETGCGGAERVDAGWFIGDGNSGPSGDMLWRHLLQGDTVSKGEWLTNSTVDPQAGEWVYPFAMTTHGGGADDSLVQIDDFYWSDSSGSPVNLPTSKKPEESFSSIRTIRTYRNGKPRSFFAPNSTANIRINASFSQKPSLGIIDSGGDLVVNGVKAANRSGLFTYNFTVQGDRGWYDVGLQRFKFHWLTDSNMAWRDGNRTNVTVLNGNLTIFNRDGPIRSDGSTWKTMKLAQSFTNPVVFATVNTADSGDGPNLAKVRNVTKRSFEVKFCEHDGTDGGCESHQKEDVGWFIGELSDLDSITGIEAGKTTLGTSSDSSGEAKSISFQESFSSDAIVIAEQQTYNHPGESIVQVPTTGTGSFSMYLCDHAGTSDSCESHGTETVAWMAIDPGASLPSFFEAGKTSTIKDSGFKQQSLSKFSEPPMVLATINTNNGGQEAKSARVKSVTASSADVGYCEHDGGDTCDTHSGERIGWLAVKGGTRGNLKNGEYESEIFSAGRTVYWTNSTVKDHVPAQTGYNLTYATNTSGSWKYYENVTDVPASRFLKFNISMRGNGTTAPEIDSISVEYNGPEDYSLIRENVFYRSERWKGNFTDGDGNKYSFRRNLTVTEPGISDRWFAPVRMELNFTFSPSRGSIRVVAWNGSRMLEIPSQLYDVNMSGGAVQDASIAMMASFNRSEERTFYVMSARASYPKSYSGLNNTDNGPDEAVGNKYYTAFFNGSMGWLMRDVYDRMGRGKSLSGVEPMDRYPQVDVPSGLEADTKKARIDSTAQLNVTEGPIMTRLSVAGGLDGSSSYPYSITCRAYAANPYMVCEKNLTSKVTEDWQDLYFNGLVFEDGIFPWMAYDTGSSITTRTLGPGDGTDTDNLAPGSDWFAFYDNETGNAVAELVLNRSMDVKGSPKYRIADADASDFYQYEVITGTESVSAGSSFYTRTARMTYNGKRGWKTVNRTYRLLNNPLSVSKGVETTNDVSAANYSRKGNVSSSDQENATVYSYWTDDTFLSTASIEITGNGISGQNTTLYSSSITIRDGGDYVNQSWINATIDARGLNAGPVYANITVTDVSGKKNHSFISFRVGDSTAPAFNSIRTDPSNKRYLDPDVEVDVTANITEYSNVSSADLFYRRWNASGWNVTAMENTSISKFNFSYNGSFTPREGSIYQYRVQTNDTEGNLRNSSVSNLSVFLDHTWRLETNISNQTASFEERVTVGNITLVNTGDFDKTFSLDAGVFNSRTWVNGTQLPTEIKVKSGQSILLQVNASTRDAASPEGADSFNLTVSNSSANPNLSYTTFQVITSTGGPFLYTEFDQYNSTVTLGDTGLNISATTVNKGNKAAQLANLTFELPSGWSFSQEAAQVSSSETLDVGESLRFGTNVDVGPNAATGNVNLTAVARSVNDTRKVTVTVNVQAPDTGDGDTGGGGGGGFFGGGGGGGGPPIPEGASDQVFNSSQSFELVRGRDQNFTMKITNPTSYNLSNVTVDLTGFQAQYIDWEPRFIRSLNVNETENITVSIEAPDYFTAGSYTLTFNATGTGTDTTGLFTTHFNFTLTKQIQLTIHEIPREKATAYRQRMRELKQDLKQANLSKDQIEELIAEAERNLQQGQYGQVQENFQQAKQLHQLAVRTRQGLKLLSSKIEDAESSGISVKQTKRVVNLARAALQRGAYQTAAARLDEARNLYALETKGAVNYVHIAKENWKKITAGAIGLIIAAILAYYRWKLYRIRKRLDEMQSREDSLRELKKQLQVDTFEKKEVPISEYEESMEDYNDQIIDVIERRVELEAKEANIIHLSERSSLVQQREQLRELIEQTQRNYVEGDISDTDIYEEKVKDLTERLSEIESRIAEIDAKAEVRRKTLTGSIMERIPLLSSGGKVKE